jgi:hypothetical protein
MAKSKTEKREHCKARALERFGITFSDLDIACLEIAIKHKFHATRLGISMSGAEVWNVYLYTQDRYFTVYWNPGKKCVATILPDNSYWINRRVPQ